MELRSEQSGVPLRATDTSSPAPTLATQPVQHWRFATAMPGVVAVLLLAALLGVFGLALLRRQAPDGGGFGINAVGRTADLKHRPAPDFAVESFAGSQILLSELQGRTVVLNFWASWCPPCREEARTLAAAAEAYTDRGVEFLGINVWDSDTEARAFLERYGVRYRNAADSSGRVTIEYGVTGLPETFLITRDGTLTRKWIGPLSQVQLDEFIGEALQ